MNNLFKFSNFNNSIAIIDEELNSHTYADLNKIILEIESKIEENSVVLILASNSFDCISGYLGFFKKKNINILLDASYDLNYINEIIKNYKPNYIFKPLKLEINKNILSQKLNLNKFNKYEIIQTNFKKKKLNFKNFLLLATSGTTQSPKFVRLSKKNIYFNTIQIIKALKIKRNDVTITTMPMSYSYGLSILNTHFQVGAKVIINNNSIFEKNFWEKINKFKVSSFGGVPSFYEFLKKIKFHERNFLKLRYITQAGGKLNDEVLNYFIKTCDSKQIKFIKMYGQTEASPRISYLSWKDLFKKRSSVGKALDGIKIYIYNNKKIEKKKFTKGEIAVYGKNVCLGYSKNIYDLKKGDINKNLIFTGDIGYLDDKNFLYIDGRKNRIMKLFGLRYNLDDFEEYFKKMKINTKCYSDDKFLIVKINLNEEKIIEKIENVFFNKFKINKNYIKIENIKNLINNKQ